jgi:hypothetical protein
MKYSAHDIVTAIQQQKQQDIKRMHQQRRLFSAKNRDAKSTLQGSDKRYPVIT